MNILLQEISESNVFHIIWNICGVIGLIVIIMTVVFIIVMFVCVLKEDYSEDRTYCIKFDCDCIQPKSKDCIDCAYLRGDE